MKSYSMLLQRNRLAHPSLNSLSFLLALLSGAAMITNAYANTSAPVSNTLPGVTKGDPSSTPGAKSYWPQGTGLETDGSNAAYGNSAYSGVNLQHGQSVNIGNGGLYLYGNNTLNGNIVSDNENSPATGTGGGPSRSGIIAYLGRTTMSGGKASIGDLIANDAEIDINDGEKVDVNVENTSGGTIQAGGDRGQGVINISGTDTIVHLLSGPSGGYLQVGTSNGHRGVVNVANGATLQSDASTEIELGGGGSGALNVDGAGSTFNADSGFLVGYYGGDGLGVLSASNGGTINITGNQGDPSDGGVAVAVGYYTGTKGAIEISSKGTLNVGAGTGVDVGRMGDGSLIIDNGNVNIGQRSSKDQTVTTALRVGHATGSVGHISVTNSGSLNVSDGTQTVIGDEGIGTLDISHDGRVSIGNSGMVIGQNSNNTQSQVTLADGVWKESGDITGNGFINYDGGVLQAGEKGFSIGVAQKLNGTTVISPNGGNITDNGVISGSGNLIVANVSKNIVVPSSDGNFQATAKNGGTFSTNAQNTYTGQTVIGQGVTLDVGTSGSIASSSNVDVLGGSLADLDNTATLKFDGDNSLQRLSGNGKVDINEGKGTLTITKALNTGFPTESQGTYGTLSVNGNINMGSGSAFNADLGPDLKASKLNASGTVTISDNSDFEIQPNQGAALKVGQSYEIIHADNGVKGTFIHYNQNGVIGGSGTYDYGVLETAGPAYSKNDVTITLLPNKERGLGWLGDRDQITTGNALESSMGSSESLSTIANTIAGLDNGNRLGALNELDGEINADSRTAMINDAFYIRDTAIGRLDCADDLLRRNAMGKKGHNSGYCGIDATRPITTWGTVYGSNGGSSGRKGYQTAAHMSDNSVGWIMGADALVGHQGEGIGRWRVGGLLAYGRNMFGAAGRNSTGHSNNVSIGAYGGTAYHVGGITKDAAVTVKLGATYSWDMIHTHRNDISFADFSDHTSASQLSGVGQVFAESGYKFTKDKFEFEPFARMTYMNYQEGSFKEHGGLAALQGKSKDSSLGFATVGAKLATMFKLGKATISPHATLAYRRAYGKINSTVHERFRAASVSGYDMSVIGTPVSQDTALLETGFSAQLIDRLSVDFNYIGQYGTHMTTSGGTGSFRWDF